MDYHIQDSNVYNEISLQLELGCFLRQERAMNVFFEKNVKEICKNYNKSFCKKEIDILLSAPYLNQKSWFFAAVELKYPRNGQHPEQMFSFIKDVKFLEQLVFGGCVNLGIAVFLADDHLFWRGEKLDGVYGYFRNKEELHGKVRKPTGSSNECIEIDGKYVIDWNVIGNNKRYFVIRVEKNAPDLRP